MGNYVGRQTRSESNVSIESVSARARSMSLMKKANGNKVPVDPKTENNTNRKHSMEKTPYRVEHLLELGKVDQATQIAHGWNPHDKSVNIFVKGDNLTLHRRPISQSTDSIRGKIGYKKGIHMWEIKWISNQRGTHACVGVATRKAPIRKSGYCSLIGNSEYSWGWDLGRNVLKHADQQVAPAFLSTEGQENHNKLSYPPMDDMDLNTGWFRNCFKCFNWATKDTSYIVPSTFQCVLDMDAGTLGFVADGQWLGTAFKGLRGKGAIYPTVSCVWGHCEVQMKYINGLASAPLSLKESSRRSIRGSLPNTSFESIRPIMLPQPLKQYIRDYGLKYHVRLNDNNDKGVNFNDVDTVDAVNDFETYTIEDSFDEDDLL